MHIVDIVLLVFGLEASQFNTLCKLLSQCIYMFQKDKFNIFILRPVPCFIYWTEGHLQEQTTKSSADISHV